MRRVFGPRTAFEAAFLVAVPVVALAVGLGPYAIVAASAVGYLLVLLLEALLWREASPLTLIKRRRAAAPPAAAPALEVQPAAEVELTAPAETAEPEAEPQPAPVVEPEPEPEPVRVLQPVPDLEPEPEPEPPPPEPEAPEPQPAAAEVVPIGIGAAPRQWNLWDLERLTREAAGSDAVLDEERTFLLLYLREFAGPDGELPVDFDGLVRDSFGKLVGVR